MGRMRGRKPVLLLVPIVALAAACGSDDSTDSDDSADEAAVVSEVEAADAAADDASQDDAAADAAEAAEAEAEATDAADDLAESAQEAGEQAAAEGVGSSGTATLALANGESFEFSILCNLESQMAAGSEILFTAVSYDDPGLDVTQFGDEGTVTGVASISVYDGEYNTLWNAVSMYPEGVELRLEGSTITGEGTFYAADDLTGETTTGELVANC